MDEIVALLSYVDSKTKKGLISKITSARNRAGKKAVSLPIELIARLDDAGRELHTDNTAETIAALLDFFNHDC